MALKVGLTGGIGSGKSTVAQIFITLGIPVFFADASAKKVMNENENLKEDIKNLFGDEAYDNEILNRKYIANIVFNDPFKLEQLNALVHPATIEMAEKWMQEQRTPYVIKEAALLFEAGSASDLDYLIGVYAPEHIRIQRVMQRDSISREEVLLRMSRQIDEKIKMMLCNFVLVNNEQKLLIPQVLELHQKLLVLNENNSVTR
jgi:dephospho-CoA kinase